MKLNGLNPLVELISHYGQIDLHDKSVTSKH